MIRNSSLRPTPPYIEVSNAKEVTEANLVRGYDEGRLFDPSRIAALAGVPAQAT